MRIINLVSLLIVFCVSYSYSQIPCNCSVLLNKKQVKVGIYQKPGEKITSYIINDTIKETYYNIHIKKIAGDYAYVNTTTTIKDTGTKTGWIAIKYLGIYANNYSKPVVLLSKPIKGANVSAQFKNPGYDMLNVVACNKSWLSVKYSVKDKQFKGWLAPDRQCSNPYTTCN